MAAVTFLALTTASGYAAPESGNALTDANNGPAADRPAVKIMDLPEGRFIRKQKRIRGGWKIIDDDGQKIIRFLDDFEARKGPDLKIFISPQSIDEVSGRTATEGALFLGLLKATKGTQDYILPNNTNLADYRSVLVHCEKYSVLWGGGEF